MSSFTASGVRKRSWDTDRLQDIITFDEQGFVQRMKPFNAESSARGLVETGAGGGSQANESEDIFTVTGKAINGAIAFVQDVIEVTVGTLSIDFFREDGANPFTSYLRLINPGVGAIINLFNGGDLPGQILKLQGDITDFVTINNANDPGNTTGNIIFPGTDPTQIIAAEQIMEFVFDPVKTINGHTGAWRFSSTDVIASSGTLPVGTAVNDHLEWNGSAPWVAQQFFEFHTTGPFADSGFLRFPNDQIMLSQRNAADSGNVELKVTVTDALDLTEGNNSPARFVVRTQHLSDPDNTIELTTGSGAAADTLIDASTTKLLIGVGGFNRLELDTATATSLLLKTQPSVTQTANFDIRSSHISDPDNTLAFSMGSGSSATALIDGTTSLLKIGVGGATRLDFDVSTTTSLLLHTPSGVTATADFNIRSSHISDPDNTLSLSVGSGAGADTLISWPAATLKLQPNGNTRFELTDSVFRKVNLDSTEPHIELFRNDSTPTAADIVGHLDFFGRDLTPATVEYTSIHGMAEAVTAGSAEGGMAWFFLRSGTPASRLAMDANDNFVLQAGTSLGLESVLGELGNIFKNETELTINTTDRIFFQVAATTEFEMNAGTFDCQGNSITDISQISWTTGGGLIQGIAAGLDFVNTGTRFRFTQGATDIVDIDATGIRPVADDTMDLGSVPNREFRDLHLDGIANIDTLNMGFGDTAQHTFFGFMTIADRTTPADPVSAASVNFFLDSASGELSVRKFGSVTVSLEGAASITTMKTSVRLATTANIDEVTGGLLTIDGVVTVAGDRVLLKDQTLGEENGIYDAAVGAWTRSTDFDTDAEATSGALVLVQEGTINDNKGFQLTTNEPITLGTTSLTFAEFGVGGAGLPHLDGNGTTDIIRNTATATKNWRMDLSPVDINTEKTFTWVGGGDATYTFQSSGGLIAAIDLAQTWTQIQTHSADIDMTGSNVDNVASLISNAATPALTGAIRLGVDEGIFWRNNAGTADIGIILQSAGSVDDIVFSTGIASINVSSNPITEVTYLRSDGGSTGLAGVLRLAHTGKGIYWRNAGSTADIVIDVTDDGIKFELPDPTTEYQFESTFSDWFGNDMRNVGDLEQDKTGSTRLHTLQRDENIAPDDTQIGLIRFRARNAAASLVNYARIVATMETDVAPEDGSLKFQVNVAGAIDTDFIKLNDAGSGEVEITKQLDMTGQSIVSVAKLSFDDTDTSIDQVTNDLEYDVASTNSHRFRINNINVLEVDVSSSTFSTDILPNITGVRNLGSSSLKFSGIFAGIYNVATSQGMKAVGADLVLETPAGTDIIFREVTTQFLRMDGGTNKNVFIRDIELDGTNRSIRAFDATEIGYFVSNQSASVGAEGSIELPFTTTASPTDAQLNTAFGNFDGACGISGSTAVSPRWQVKVNNNWNDVALANSN